MTLVLDDIPIQAQLELEETDKYLRAYVYDKDKVEIAGSPFNMTHVSGGLYKKTGVAMPDTTNVTVKVLVYDDSNFLTRTAHYPPVITTYEKAYEIGIGKSTIDVECEIDQNEVDVEIDYNEIDAEIEEC